MKAVVVSDLHIGSPHFARSSFLRFLDGIPRDASIILNGDVVHKLDAAMDSDHQQVLDRIYDEAERRNVIWIRGNHDKYFQPSRPTGIEFTKHHAIGRRLYISHGTEFVPFGLLSRVAGCGIAAARFVTRVEDCMSIRDVKKVPFLIGLLTRGMMRNAVNFAKKHGYEAIACGHVHVPEDRLEDGVRYMNLGTWTDMSAHYLEVDDNSISFSSGFPGSASADGRKRPR